MLPAVSAPSKIATVFRGKKNLNTTTTTTTTTTMSQQLYEQSLPAEGAIAPDRSNPIVAEFLEIVLKEARRLAAKDPVLTVEDLFRAAEFHSSGDIPRAKRPKVSAWNLAMKHEVSSVPDDIAKDPVMGVGKDGRPGFSGQYPKWLSAKLKAEPELRERYQRKADRMNGIHSEDEDGEDGHGTAVGTGPLDLRSQQKKALKEIAKMVYSTGSFELVQVHIS